MQEKAQEHMKDLFMPLGRELVEQQLAEARILVEAQIITPVVDALTTEVEITE